ncbi:MAG: UDP-glucose/GDP-mannose dehydrogenase family protein, partial [Candidatus Moraniibacteriota bacterium]
VYVNCIDVDKKRVGALKKGRPVIYEPGLAGLIKSNLDAGRLSFCSEFDSIEDSQILMIAVGTPSRENGEANLDYVFKVAETIGKRINDYKLIVQKSTVPVGTCRKIEGIIKNQIEKRGVDVKFSVASNPEFLKEGDAVDDFLKPDRIILGVDNTKAKNLLERLYKPFMRKRHKTIFMSVESAELTKYAANCMLATRISFMNEMSRIAEKVGADIEEVRSGIGSDPRIGESFLYPGVGYGGSCFPKDVRAMIEVMKKHKTNVHLVEAVDQVNEYQKFWFLDKILGNLNGEVKRSSLAIWGLSFKAGTDDVRESPAIFIAHELLERKAFLRLFDPEAMDNFKQVFPSANYNAAYCSNEYEALREVDALIILNDWPLFRNPDYEKMKQLMRNPIIFDGKNLLNAKEARQEGFVYHSVGRQ